MEIAMFNLQITDIDINKAWEISPYNGLAYGALILVLCVICMVIGWTFNKYVEKTDLLISEKDKVIRESYEKTHQIADVLSEKLSELKGENKTSKEKIIYILEDIKSKFDKFNHN